VRGGELLALHAAVQSYRHCGNDRLVSLSLWAKDRETVCC
jgi:hypothetical protein